jgi:hypothetical protein
MTSNDGCLLRFSPLSLDTAVESRRNALDRINVNWSRAAAVRFSRPLQRKTGASARNRRKRSFPFSTIFQLRLAWNLLNAASSAERKLGKLFNCLGRRPLCLSLNLMVRAITHITAQGAASFPAITKSAKCPLPHPGIIRKAPEKRKYENGPAEYLHWFYLWLSTMCWLCRSNSTLVD